MKYYDGGRLLGMTDLEGNLPEIYISSTNRSGGKTTYFNRYAFKRWRLYKEKFMLVYRYINELDEVEDKFFKEISSLFFPDLIMTSRKSSGGKFRNLFVAPALEWENEKEIPWEHCGYAVALNASEKLKRFSHLFSDTCRMIFDEFQSESGIYLNREVEKLISLHTSVARGGGMQSRRVPIIMISNPVSMINPYYTAMGISKRLDDKTKFLRGNGWVMEQGYVDSAAKAQEKSAFNRAFKDMDYMAYNQQGVYLNDHSAFVTKLTEDSRYVSTIIYKGQKFNLRHSISGLYYLGQGCDESFPIRVSVSADDHDVNQVMLGQYAYFLMGVRRAFELGAMRFQNLTCKECALDMLSY